MSNKPTTLEHLRATALRSEALAADVAAAAAAAIEELAGAWHTITLPVDDWVDNTDTESLAAGYAFCCDAPLAGVTSKDSAESLLSFASMAEARASSMSPSSEVLDGKIRYYAVTKPATAIIMQVRPILGGASS